MFLNHKILQKTDKTNSKAVEMYFFAFQISFVAQNN